MNRHFSACQVEYHKFVFRWIPASLAVFGLLLPSALVSSSGAQINGAPASVTSPGFGGHAVNGAPASVTSVGRGGFAPSPNTHFSSNSPQNNHNGDHRGEHPHHPRYGYGELYAVPVAVPYAEDSANEVDPDNDPDYQGGPTIFDRRGRGAEAYVPPAPDASPAHVNQNFNQDATADPLPPEPAPEPTWLVFKDGHRLEVGNYAIVGQTLFDLTPGHARKVALAALDLDATQKQNDDRGVTFQLPPAAQAN
jgi:hypothetical protein